MRWRLQPYTMEAATLGAEAATPCGQAALALSILVRSAANQEVVRNAGAWLTLTLSLLTLTLDTNPRPLPVPPHSP